MQAYHLRHLAFAPRSWARFDINNGVSARCQQHYGLGFLDGSGITQDFTVSRLPAGKTKQRTSFADMLGGRIEHKRIRLDGASTSTAPSTSTTQAPHNYSTSAVMFTSLHLSTAVASVGITPQLLPEIHAYLRDSNAADALKLAVERFGSKS